MNYDLLCQIVSQELETLITLSEEEKKEISGQLEYYGRNRGNSEEKRAAASLKKRERQIERFIGKLYEDRVNKVVEEERFRKLLTSYEQELKEIGAEANTLK